MIGFIDILFRQLVTMGNYSANAISTLYSSLLHPLVSSVLTSRILATDLYQSHCHFKSHMESSFAQPNSFLAIILQLPIPETRLNSIPLLPSSYSGRLASRNSTESKLCLSWCPSTQLGLTTRFLLLSDSCGFVDMGRLSDERTGLPFTIAAGPRQRSHSWVRVPRDS
jgi:hypothetical protein